MLRAGRAAHVSGLGIVSGVCDGGDRTAEGTHGLHAAFPQLVRERGKGSLADAEAGEDASEQVVGAELAGDLAQAVLREA